MFDPCLAFVPELGQSEVQHFHLATRSHEKIGGFDVAMDNALRVGRVQRVGDLNSELHHLLHLQRPTLDAMLQGFAFEQFHGDERLAILLADVVNGADVGMIKRRSGLRLALETDEGLRIPGHFLRQELEGNETMQPGIFGFIDHAHPATAELFQNPVMGDGLTDHERRTDLTVKPC